MAMAMRRCGRLWAFCSRSEPWGMSGFGLFIVLVGGAGRVGSIALRRWFISFSRRRFSSKKRRAKSFLQILLFGTFDGPVLRSIRAGAAGGAAKGGLIELSDCLAKHLTPLPIVLKHVKTGAGWRKQHDIARNSIRRRFLNCF